MMMKTGLLLPVILNGAAHFGACVQLKKTGSADGQPESEGFSEPEAEPISVAVRTSGASLGEIQVGGVPPEPEQLLEAITMDCVSLYYEQQAVGHDPSKLKLAFSVFVEGEEVSVANLERKHGAMRRSQRIDLVVKYEILAQTEVFFDLCDHDGTVHGEIHAGADMRLLDVWDGQELQKKMKLLCPEFYLLRDSEKYDFVRENVQLRSGGTSSGGKCKEFPLSDRVIDHKDFFDLAENGTFRAKICVSNGGRMSIEKCLNPFSFSKEELADYFLKNQEVMEIAKDQFSIDAWCKNGEAKQFLGELIKGLSKGARIVVSDSKNQEQSSPGRLTRWFSQ